MNYRNFFWIILASLLFTLPVTHAQEAEQPSASYAMPNQEMRGLWVVRDDLETPASIQKVVAEAKAHHFNALFVQVRGRGDAMYQSTLEPRAEELSGQPRGFDPLAEVLRQAHAVHLQVHAWMNTCYIWGAGRKPYAANHIVNQHPDWLARDAHNHYMLCSGPECEGAFMTPANLAARQHIHDVFLDVARRYDVDGIHFDYIRYPNASYDYSDAALERFKISLQTQLSAAQIADFARRGRNDRLVYPHAFPAQWLVFRREQVTEMVASISHDIKAIKPWMIISAAVFADSKDARAARGQDWKNWLQHGYLDAVVPMAYGVSTPAVAGQIADAVKCAHAAGRFAYAGLGAWHIPAASTVAKIEVARTLGSQGAVLFSYGGITHDGKSDDYLNAVVTKCYRHDVPVPLMPWVAPRPSNQSAHTQFDSTDQTAKTTRG